MEVISDQLASPSNQFIPSHDKLHLIVTHPDQLVTHSDQVDQRVIMYCPIYIPLVLARESVIRLIVKSHAL